VKMTWKLQVNERKEIGLYLYRESPVPLQLYATHAVTFHSDREHEDIVWNSEQLDNFTRKNDNWGWEPLFDLSDLSHYVDAQGSFNLKVEADFFVESDGVFEILPLEGKGSASSEVESSKMRKDIILKQVAALLGDEVTSDVHVSVFDKENAEIGSFFCHSAILSGELLGMRH